MQVLDVSEAILCPSSLGPLLGPEPEGLCVNSAGVLTIRAGVVGVRFASRCVWQDAYAIGQVLNEFVAKSILLDIAQPRGRA
jgi:hypothetical protein